MNKLEQHRRTVTDYRCRMGYGHPRKEKRFWSKAESAHSAAYTEGMAAAYSRSPVKNPYPPGKRHDAWNMGYNHADPMGDHHGENV